MAEGAGGVAAVGVGRPASGHDRFGVAGGGRGDAGGDRAEAVDVGLDLGDPVRQAALPAREGGLFLVVGALEALEAGELVLQLSETQEVAIAGGERLDLAIGQLLGVVGLQRPWAVGVDAHDLADETGLALQGLPTAPGPERRKTTAERRLDTRTTEAPSTTPRASAGSVSRPL